MQNKLFSVRRLLRPAIFIWIVLLFTSFVGTISKVTIKVKDKLSGDAIPFPSISISKDDSIVSTGTCDIEGIFTIHLIPGKYIIKSSFIGYIPAEQTVDIGEDPKYLTFELEPLVKLPETVLMVHDYVVPVMDSNSKEGVSDDSKDTRALNASAPTPRVAKESLAVSKKKSSEPDGRSYNKGIEADSRVAEENFSGRLTAGEINDFSKWKLWENESGPILKSVASKYGIEAGSRFCFQVVNEDGWPVIDATVKLMNDGKTIFIARTDNAGRAECWISKNEEGNTNNLSAKIISKSLVKEVKNVSHFEKGINHILLKQVCERPETLDLAFIVDATGSMMDEIAYLKAEMLDLIHAISANNDNLIIRVGSVFYRDTWDKYLVRHSDFTTNMESALSFIQMQGADGGGDFPEAMDTALVTAVERLSWSREARARLAIIIADAPPHNSESNRKSLNRGVTGAAKKGIRIIPLACSGVDKSMEYLMRNMALLTNGIYLYLTDDSKVGGSHMPPTTDKIDHKKLNKLLLNVITRFTESPACPDPDRNNNGVPVDSISYFNVDSLNAEELDLLIKLEAGGTGITSPGKNRLLISPNPSEGKILISYKERMNEIQVYDMTGKALKKVSTNSDNMQIDLTDFPVGKYIVRANSEVSSGAGIAIITH